MTPSHHGGSAARLSDADLEVMLARAAEEGADGRSPMSGSAVRTPFSPSTTCACGPNASSRATDSGADGGTGHHHRGVDRASRRHCHKAALVRSEPAIRRRSCAGAFVSPPAGRVADLRPKPTCFASARLSRISSALPSNSLASARTFRSMRPRFARRMPPSWCRSPDRIPPLRRMLLCRASALPEPWPSSWP